jgi:hypothetical protein
MKGQVDAYEPFNVNEIGGGLFSFHLFANPVPVEVEIDGIIVTRHKVDVYKTSPFYFKNKDSATLFISENWQTLVDECQKIEEEKLSADARDKRDQLLNIADIAVNKAEDLQDEEAIAKARTYRQALRDVPEQEGFPTDIIWPVL